MAWEELYAPEYESFLENQRERKLRKMSNDNTVYLQGPIMFAKVFEGNRDKGQYAPKDGQYTIDVGLKGNDVKMVKSWNKNYKAKNYKAPYNEQADSKLSYFQFKRKHKQFNKEGEVIEDWSGPPKVVDAEGEPWGDRGLIGNGSVCTVKLNVANGTFTDDNGKPWPVTFVRLEGIRVDEWVEYEADNKTENNKDDSDVDDEIPF